MFSQDFLGGDVGKVIECEQEIAVGGRRGIGGKGRAEMAHGVVQLTFRLAQAPQVVVSGGVVRTQSQRLMEGGAGLGVTIQRGERVAQDIVRLGSTRFKRERVAEGIDGGLECFGFEQSHAKIEPDRRVVRGKPCGIL
jgi:hypothetical protein